jgi:hypothetical protein
MLQLTCFLSVLSSQTATSDTLVTLSGVADLQQKISIRRKIVPIAEAIKELSDSTKVDLTLQPALRGLKLTLLIKDRPAGQVLDAVASTLGHEWHKTNKGFELRSNPQFQQAQASYERMEREEETKFAEHRLARLIDGAGQPYEDIADALDQLRQEETALLREMNAGWQDRQREIINKRSGLQMAQQGDNYLAGTVLKGLDEDDWKDLWTGNVVYASTATPKGKSQLPNAAFDILHFPRSRNGKVCIFVQLDPATLTLRYRSLLYGGTYPVGSKFDLDSSMPPVVERLVKHPFKALLTGWAATRTSLLKDPLLQDEVKSDEGKATPSQYFSQHYSESDQLEWFFDRTNISVVAEGFRVPHKWSRLNNGRGSAAIWLRDFLGTTDGWCKLDNGIACVRRGDFWKLRHSEIPEEWLRPLEAKREADLTVSDFAALAAKLNPYQSLAISKTWSYLTKFDQYSFDDGLPALRFFASLHAQQKKELLASGGLAFKDLTDAERSLFTDAVLSGAFDGATFDADFIKLFDQRFDPQVLNDFGVLLVLDGVQRTGRYHPPRPIDTSEPGSTTVVRGPGIRFVFGRSPASGVSYTIKSLVLE